MGAAGDVGACVTAGAALIALPVAVRQIRVTRATAREVRVYAYMDRFNDKDLLNIIARARDFWALGPEAGLPLWLAMNRKTRQEIVLPMNVLEELGQMYEDGLVDRKIVKRTIGFAAKNYYAEARWFIDYYREERFAEAWAKWGAMNQRLDDPERTRHRLGEPWPSGSSVF